jgi:hypothetical protein
MSTNSSVACSTGTPEKDCSTGAPEKDRSAGTLKRDRSRLCSFTFADGRQCRTPRRAGHSHLCFFHARKEAQSLAAEEVGKDISSFLSGDFLSACDLTSALGRLFSAVAKGDIKPRTASTLAYLGQTMVQSIQIAQHEYCEAFSPDHWRRTVRSSFTPSSAPAAATPQSASAPRPPMPRTGAEFAQRVMSGPQTGEKPSQP